MEKYSKRIIWLHWISSLLIFALIFTGISMENETNFSFKLRLYQIHFSLGILVFFLTIWRVIAFLRDKRPSDLYPMQTRQKLINFVHKGFYVLILWMCFSGIVSLFVENIWQAVIYNSIANMPDLSSHLIPIMLSHHIMAKFVFLLLIIHLAGVFSHLLKTKQNVIKRILP